MKILIAYSSRTGNTQTLCEGVAKGLESEHQVTLTTVKNAPNYNDYGLIVAGFWADKGTANKETKKFIKSIKNKKIILLGTLGADPESDHAQDVKRNVGKLVDNSNEYLGVFLARGLVDEKLIKRMKLLPLPRKIVNTMYEASITSRPTNAEDVANALIFINNLLVTV